MTRDQEMRLRIARRAAQELAPGSVVNLGIGIPVLVSQFIRPEDGIYLHSENGVLGFGPPPADGVGDPDLVNAAKEMVTERPGTVFFDSVTSFAMIRGGHVDVAVLGALQVDESGSLANWAVPGQAVLGVGGAMDLAAGARRVIAVMTHCTPRGEPKFVPRCTLPLTAAGVVDTIVTELAVFRRRPEGFALVDLAPGVTAEQVAACTAARYTVDWDAIAANRGRWE